MILEREVFLDPISFSLFPTTKLLLWSVGVANKIDKKRRDFVWEGNNEGSKHHLVSYE